MDRQADEQIEAFISAKMKHGRRPTEDEVREFGRQMYGANAAGFHHGPERRPEPVTQEKPEAKLPAASPRKIGSV